MSEFDWAWPEEVDREAVSLNFVNDDANVIPANNLSPHGSPRSPRRARGAYNAGHDLRALVADLGSQEIAR